MFKDQFHTVVRLDGELTTDEILVHLDIGLHIIRVSPTDKCRQSADGSVGHSRLS